jgi:DNA-binding NarL/FixJ family response regulator
MEKLSIILADNQALTRSGTIAFLNSYFNNQVIIEEAKTKEELFEKLSILQPNALIIDFQLIDLNEIAELTEIKKISPHTGVLVITDNQSPDDIYKVLDSGITNLIFKSCEEEEFIDAFKSTISNKKYFCSEILDLLIERKSASRRVPETGKLTYTEIEITKLIAQGLTTKEIASQKNLSFHTIITHRKNIFRKLHINNTSELLMYAMHTGIIDSTEYYI